MGRFSTDWGFVSTAYVTDASQPYETAVKHREYNDGKIVIVEGYDTKNEAALGHERWVAAMTADQLPEKLVDCGSSEISLLCDAFGGDNEWRIKDRVLEGDVETK